LINHREIKIGDDGGVKRGHCPQLPAPELPNLHSKFGNSGIAGSKDFLLQGNLFDYTIIVYVCKYFFFDFLLDVFIMVLCSNYMSLL